MRLSLFVSAVFAASLFTGAAMADRPGEDGGRTGRLPAVRELRVHEAKQMKEARPAEARTTKVRDTTVTERFRNRGDVVDRYAGTTSAAASKAQVTGHNIKSQRNAEKALERLNAKKSQVINCAPGDDACSGSSRAAAAGAQAARQNNGAAADQKTKNDRQRAEIQKMIDAIRAERMKAKMMEMMCKMKASACGAEIK